MYKKIYNTKKKDNIIYFQQWKLFNELHIYSIESNKWTAINTLETPPPTSAHSATIHGNLMVVFGGVCNGYRYIFL